MDTLNYETIIDLFSKSNCTNTEVRLKNIQNTKIYTTEYNCKGAFHEANLNINGDNNLFLPIRFNIEQYSKLCSFEVNNEKISLLDFTVNTKEIVCSGHYDGQDEKGFLGTNSYKITFEFISNFIKEKKYFVVLEFYINDRMEFNEKLSIKPYLSPKPVKDFF